MLRKLELVSRLFAMTRRMHTKAWISDREVAIVGGRNIGDAYFDAADTNFRDLDLVLLGPAVDQAVAIFEAFWEHKAAWPVHRLHPRHRHRHRHAVPARTEAADLLRPVGTRHSIMAFLAASNDLNWIRDVRVIADPPDKVLGKQRGNWLMRELLPAIEGCRERLEIVSPYFIPGPAGSAVLERLVQSGARVDVLTNSLAATDVAAVHGAYAKYRKRLLRGGIRLYELQPFRHRSKISVFGSRGASLHTKAFTVDDRVCFVGSFNFDPRSVSLNAEMGVLFNDPKLAAELGRVIRRERSPRTSYRISMRGKSLHWEGDDHGRMRRYEREPEAGRLRRLLAAVVRWLPIESQL
jgi:cardiolipin synthase C